MNGDDEDPADRIDGTESGIRNVSVGRFNSISDLPQFGIAAMLTVVTASSASPDDIQMAHSFDGLLHEADANEMNHLGAQDMPSSSRTWLTGRFKIDRKDSPIRESFSHH